MNKNTVITKRCAFTDCSTIISSGEDYCVPCSIKFAVIGISDENAWCKKLGYRQWVTWMLSNIGVPLRPNWEHPTTDLKIAVSQGRWYVRCPDPVCKCNMPIDFMEPFVFCIDCQNVAQSLRAYNVNWMEGARVRELLAGRPRRKERNYLPHLGETIDHLVTENIKRGYKT